LSLQACIDNGGQATPQEGKTYGWGNQWTRGHQWLAKILPGKIDILKESFRAASRIDPNSPARDRL